ncbi:MAG TPA: Gldg family protein [Vicinamibacterales bacterium]|nr:Gldg family protein [Vicinamibacterales bacterium]
MQKILGIIGWIGTALVFGAVAVRMFYPDWNQYATYAAWAGLVSVLIYMAGQWRDVAQFYQGRGAKYGTMSIVSIVVFLGILVAINYLATRQNKRWDLTANQVYSLSDQTIKILRELQEPVQVTVFERNESQQVHKDRLDEYRYYSTQLSTEFIDPDREPAKAGAAKIETLPTILFQYKGRTERVTNSNEQDMTNALIKVVTGAARKVYFIQGHGEKDIASSDRAGFSTAADAMKQDNFGVESLVLVQQKTVPDDATIVVIAGPITDYFPPEIEALNAYLAKGGKLLVMLDPLLKGPALPLLTQFLADWGITAGTDVVLDASGMGQQLLGTDASVPVAAQYPPHAITEGFRVLTAYPMSRSMTPVEGGANSRTAQAIVNTSPQSWSEADVAGLSAAKAQVEFNADKGDKQGPISLAAAVSAPATVVPPPPSANGSPASPDAERKPESRVVAIGDSDFASNVAIAIAGNRDFFMNSMNWLSQQENLIAVRPRQPEDRRLTLTVDQQNRIAILVLFIIPGLIFATGVYTWWKRR